MVHGHRNAGPAAQQSVATVLPDDRLVKELESSHRARTTDSEGLVPHSAAAAAEAVADIRILAAMAAAAADRRSSASGSGHQMSSRHQAQAPSASASGSGHQMRLRHHAQAPWVFHRPVQRGDMLLVSPPSPPTPTFPRRWLKTPVQSTRPRHCHPSASKRSAPRSPEEEHEYLQRARNFIRRYV